MMRHRGVFALCPIAAAALILTACSGNNSQGVLGNGGKGHVQIVMTSTAGTAGTGTTAVGAAGRSLVTDLASLRAEQPQAPSCGDSDRALQTAMVTFSSIAARTADTKELRIVDMTNMPMPINLMDLVNGNQATFPIGSLEVGTYDQLVVVMTRIDLTFTDGATATLTPPGGGWTSIVPVAEPFTVVDGETTTVNLKFRADLSFGCMGGHWSFDPRFDCEGHHREH